MLIYLNDGKSPAGLSCQGIEKHNKARIDTFLHIRIPVFPIIPGRIR